MAVFLIAWSSLKKKKGVAISLGILIMLSAAMFQVGLTLISDIGSFYEQENDRLMGPHYVVRFLGNDYEDRYLDFFLSDERVEATHTQEILLMDTAEFEEGGTISANFKNMDQDSAFKGYEVVEHTGVSGEYPVYIPTFFKEMGYRLGGELTLIFNRQPYTFTIAGFVQSTWFASSVSTLVDIYMPEAVFQNLYAKTGGGYLLSVRVNHLEDLAALIKDFETTTKIPLSAISMNAAIMAITIEEMKTGCTLVVTLFSAVLLTFSILIIGVVLIVIKFRTSNHIESQMVTIGALEAMGYTGRQIQWSVALEFLLIALFGIPAGVLLSYGIITGLGRLIVSSLGVSYKTESSLIYSLVSALIMLIILLIISQATAAKAAKITPVKALRQGMESHSFQKNHIPLDKTQGSVSVLLGMKQVIFNKKAYLMTGTIFAAISFACACAVILFVNMGLDDTLALQLSGYEISDIMVSKAPHADYDALSADLIQVEGVRKVALYETQSVSVEDELLTCYVSDDFSKLEMVRVYEGVFPRYDNEIVITGVLAKSWGKKIGDRVTVRSTSGIQAEYVICGLTQTMSNFGKQCIMHQSGYFLIQPSYERQTIQVYLEPEQDINLAIERLEQQFHVLSPSARSEKADRMEQAKKTAEEKIANLLSMYGVDSVQYALMADGEIVLKGDTDHLQINQVTNNRRLFIANINTISSSIRLMTAVIAAATALIIMLVFHMVIKTMLSRKRHEFGIYKAVGYTDRQLMQQITISFLPSSIGGTVLGMTGAYFSISRLSSLLFEQLGISKLELVVNPWILFFLGVGIVLFSYGISMLVSRKMKDITVYEFLTEV